LSALFHHNLIVNMNLFRLSWKNLISKPLTMGLSLVLVALGVGLTSILLLINQQFQDRLYKNIDGINMVIGAKGSPLQMILSSVYHIDVPTGNIPLKKTKWISKSKFVEKAIPLALGDSYKGFRIVGTDSQLAVHYKARMDKGKHFEKDMEACIGSKVAQKLNLKIGSSFVGSHGLVNDGMHVHDTHPYKVVGIFDQSGTVLDQLILTNVASVWRVHEDHEHDHDEEGEHNHDHGDAHDHDHDHAMTMTMTMTTTTTTTTTMTTTIVVIIMMTMTIVVIITLKNWLLFQRMEKK
jgi:putative ABC transport system permease protein